MPRKTPPKIELRTEFRARRIAPPDVLRHYVICMLLQRGHSVREIAAAFGVTRQGIQYQIDRFGLFPYNMILENLHKIRKKYKNDATVSLVLNQAAEAIVQLDNVVRTRLKGVDAKTLLSGEFFADSLPEEPKSEIEILKDTGFLQYGSAKKSGDEDEPEEHQTAADFGRTARNSRQTSHDEVEQGSSPDHQGQEGTSRSERPSPREALKIGGDLSDIKI